VLDINDWISKSGPDDVRWETIEQIELFLTNGTYDVPPEQVAAKLIEHMLERRRSVPAESAADEIAKSMTARPVGEPFSVRAQQSSPGEQSEPNDHSPSSTHP
jgi:hypothetical protein